MPPVKGILVVGLDRHARSHRAGRRHRPAPDPGGRQPVPAAQPDQSSSPSASSLVTLVLQGLTLPWLVRLSVPPTAQAATSKRKPRAGKYWKLRSPTWKIAPEGRP